VQWSIANIFGNKSLGLGFCWNGKNDDESRHKAAERLAQHIFDTYDKSNKEPITLIGHSHGGNLAIEAANILIEKHGVKAEQINIVAVNTPREHDFVLWHKDVNIFAINAFDDKVQWGGSDGSGFFKKSPRGDTFIGNTDKTIWYKDQYKSDKKLGIELNHGGIYSKNVKVWILNLKKAVDNNKAGGTKKMNSKN
jgi:hypothetical protein